MIIMQGIVSFTLLLISCCSRGATLQCRSHENGSEAELKRITRNCMQRLGETTLHSANPNVYSSNNHQRYGNKQNEASSDEMPNRRENTYYDHNHQNYGSYDLNYNLMVQRNRQRQNNDGSLRQLRASASNNSGSNNERTPIGNNRAAQQGNNGNNNTSSPNENCIAHCFFSELKTLNSADFPDRQKITYMLTKDLRDRELQTFYNDTIEECFHYMESQRRRNGKCNYSSDLIRCMSEYAKANCDDWHEYSNIIFN